MSSNEEIPGGMSQSKCVVAEEDLDLLKRMVEAEKGRIFEIGRIAYDGDAFDVYIVLGANRMPHLVYVRIFCS